MKTKAAGLSTGTRRAGATDAASRRLSLCGALIPWVTAAFVIAASLANPGYSHVSETVSLLGTPEREHPELIRIGFVVLGVLTHCLAFGLYRVLGRGQRARVVLVLLAVCGTCVLLSGLFRDDPEAPGVQATLEGGLHSASAFGALWVLVLAMAGFAWAVRGDRAWSGFARLSIAVVVVVLLVSAGFAVGPLKPYEGLLQRFLYAVLLVWVEVVSLRAYRAAQPLFLERGGIAASS